MSWEISERYWERWEKHRPIRHVLWCQLIESTEHGNARYKHGLPMTIEEIELHCIDHGVELPREHPTRRRYYIELDFVVGASRGQETRYVYAEWHKNGAVHGRPITLAELQRKGLSRGTN